MTIKPGDLVRLPQSHKWDGIYLVVSKPYTTVRRDELRMGPGVVVLVDGDRQRVSSRACEKVQ
jgi:hypothetical protein